RHPGHHPRARSTSVRPASRPYASAEPTPASQPVESRARPFGADPTGGPGLRARLAGVGHPPLPPNSPAASEPERASSSAKLDETQIAHAREPRNTAKPPTQRRATCDAKRGQVAPQPHMDAGIRARAVVLSHAFSHGGGTEKPSCRD